jgi:SAM-dependent methyltransferase
MALDYLKLIDSPCIKCGGGDFVTLIENDRYFMGLVTVGCSDCGLIQMNPLPTDEAFNMFYQKDYRHFYQGIVKPSDEYIKAMKKAERLDYTVDFLTQHAQLQKAATVLDFGCSEGALFDAMVKHGFVGQLFGVEPNPDFAAFAAKNNNAKVYASIDDVVETMDLIVVNHVFEHLVNPTGFLKTIQNKLSETGLLYIDVPDADRYKSINDFHIAHVVHYTIRTLHSLLIENGFEVVSIGSHEPPSHPKSIRVIAKFNAKISDGNKVSATNKNTELLAWRNIETIPSKWPAFRHAIKVKRRAFKSWVRTLFA